MIITIAKSDAFKPHRSSRSTASSSARPTEFSYWTSWSNMNKLGDYIKPRRRRGGNGNDYSSHSDLTEENLGEHNKLHGVISHKAHIIDYITSVDKRNNKCSLYYKGLTDYTLSLNREKNTPSGADSPGRESLTTTIFTSSSSSISTLLVKVQEFGTSCLACRRSTTVIK